MSATPDQAQAPASGAAAAGAQAGGGATAPPAQSPKKIGYLEDDNGNNSSMRLMSLIAVIASIVFGLITLTHKEAGLNGVYITASFLIAAFAPKALQKFAETKFPKP